MSRPRIRTLKPDTWADEKIGALSRDARLLFVTLITLADDEGRLRELPALIVGHGFPYDPDAPELLGEWLEQLAGAGLVQRYVSAGRPYLTLPGFGRHQVINRPSPSELPAPPNGPLSRPPDGNHGAVHEVSRKDHGQVSAGREGKGKEGNPSPDPSRASSGGEPEIPVPAAPDTSTPALRSLGANPRARGTNPRRRGRQLAAAQLREQAEHAAAALEPPGLSDRMRWQKLRAALRAAASPRAYESWFSRLELVAAAGEVLVLDAPDQRAWLTTARIGNLIDTCAAATGVRARLATAGEHEGLASGAPIGTPA